jgi:hypothetical protein
MKCRFVKEWVGTCTEDVIEGSDYCEEHSKLKCVSCGAQATQGCSETGSMVCGAPLCNECDHTTFPTGSNGGIGFRALPLPPHMKHHCKKTEQRYHDWMCREMIKSKHKDIRFILDDKNPDHGKRVRGKKAINAVQDSNNFSIEGEDWINVEFIEKMSDTDNESLLKQFPIEYFEEVILRNDSGLVPWCWHNVDTGEVIHGLCIECWKE